MNDDWLAAYLGRFPRSSEGFTLSTQKGDSWSRRALREMVMAGWIARDKEGLYRLTFAGRRRWAKYLGVEI